MRKNISLAIAATLLGLAVTFPAFAGEAAVALIEGLTTPSQRVELMTYAHVGQVIRLSPDQTMVLSYRDSCVRETVTGGTVTVGTEQSEVRSGQVNRIQGYCATAKKVELSDGETNAGGRAFRGVVH